MWNLAYRLAHCGEHQNYQAIEWELQAYGYPQARQLLYDARVRARLDAICADAFSRAPSSRCGKVFRRWATGTEVSEQGILTLAPGWTTNSTLHAAKRMVASFAIASAIRIDRQ